MTQQQRFGDSDGWTEEDFVFVQYQPTNGELWREQPTQPRLRIAQEEQVVDSTAPRESSPSNGDQEEPAEEIVGSDFGGIEDTGTPEDVGLLDPDDYAQLTERDLFEDEEPFEQSLGDEIEYLELGEANYEDDLSSPAFVPFEDGAGVYRTLQMDEWLAEIPDLAQEEREEAATWVGGLRPPRFGNWLPWLKDQNWNGRTLLAFLRFQAYWDGNWELWVVRIPSRNHEWVERHNRHTMTREMALELAKLRLECSPQDVIEDEWIDEWWYKQPHELMDEDIYSLAHYALQMARWGGIEPWPKYPETNWKNFWSQ